MQNAYSTICFKKGMKIMNERLKQYLDTVFAPYEESGVVREIKGELYTDLQEKLADLRKEGYDEEAAFKKGGGIHR